MSLTFRPLPRKLILSLLMAVFLYTSCYAMPKANAAGAAGIAFAGGLGFIGASETAAGAVAVLTGPVGIGLFAVACGVTAYAVYKDDIDAFAIQVSTGAVDGIQRAWDQLDQATKDAWNSAAGTWDSTKDNVINLTKNMANSISNFFGGAHVAVKPLNLNANFPYVATLNNGDSTTGFGYAMKGTFTQTEVNKAVIWQANYTDKFGATSLWAFIPTQWEYDKNASNQATGFRAWYGWVQKQSDGTWLKKTFTLNDGRTLNGIQVSPSSITQSIFVAYNGDPMINVTATNIADAYLSLEGAIGQYKRMLMNYAADVVGTWTGADVIDPTLDRFLEKAKTRVKDKENISIAIPAGAVTNTGSTTKVTGLTRTQVGTMSDAIPKTETPTEPGTDYNPPKESDSINWSPLLLAGNLFTKKFPFSIPWDIKNQLNVFNVSPQAPAFNIDSGFNVSGKWIPMKFSMDLSTFDTIAAFARWALIIAFDLAVIMAMRKFMPE